MRIAHRSLDRLARYYQTGRARVFSQKAVPDGSRDSVPDRVTVSPSEAATVRRRLPKDPGQITPVKVGVPISFMACVSQRCDSRPQRQIGIRRAIFPGALEVLCPRIRYVHAQVPPYAAPSAASNWACTHASASARRTITRRPMRADFGPYPLCRQNRTVFSGVLTIAANCSSVSRSDMQPTPRSVRSVSRATISDLRLMRRLPQVAQTWVVSLA
jgi:hypothetical protein